MHYPCSRKGAVWKEVGGKAHPMLLVAQPQQGIWLEDKCRFLEEELGEERVYESRSIIGYERDSCSA